MPDNYGANYSYRNPLVESAAKLLETVPENLRASEVFKKNVRGLFREVFSGRNHSKEIIEPFFPYLGQDFIDDEVLGNDNVFDSEKHRYVSEARLHGYYETQSVTNLNFYLHCEGRSATVQWFKGLTEEKRGDILLTRLNLVPSRYNLDEIIKYAKDSRLFRLVAEKLEMLKAWEKLFTRDENSFDPDSPEGKVLEKVAKYFHPELWILHEISASDPDKGDCLDTISKIKQYFGDVNPPSEEVRKLIAQALSENNPRRVNFLSRFLK